MRIFEGFTFMKPLDERKAEIFAAFFNAAAFLHATTYGYLIRDDTGGYYAKAVFRTPGYPLFLDALTAIAGAQTNLIAMLAQNLLVMFCAFFLARTLSKHFKLSPLIFVMIDLVLIAPLLPVSAIHMDYALLANDILAEALAYSLCLLSAAYMVKSIFEPGNRNIFIFFALAAANTLVRTQMLFMYGAGAALLLCLYFRDRDSRRLARGAVFGVCALGAAALFDASYHYFANGVFTRTPFKNFHYAGNMLFLSGKEDLELFRESPDKKIMENIYLKLEDKKCLAKYGPPVLPRYRSCLDEIMWKTLAAGYFAANGDRPDDAKAFVRLEAFSKRIFDTLKTRHRRDFAGLFFAKLYGAAGWFEYLLLGLLLFLPAWQLRDPRNILLIFAAAAVIFNTAGVCLVTHAYFRYLFYTRMLGLALLLAAAGSPVSNTDNR